MPFMHITAIIVTYNSAGVVAGALQSLMETPEISRCIVVDNGSDDGTPAFIAQKFPLVTCLTNTQNNGFAAACNQALQHVGTEAVLFLNPDARIGRTAIVSLLSHLQTSNKTACAAPLMAGHVFAPCALALRLLPWRKKTAARQPERAIPVLRVSGAIALWRTAALRELKGFDEQFFLFYEDDDLCKRARMAGYSLLLVTGIEAHHMIGQASPVTDRIKRLKRFHSNRSFLRYTRKHNGQRHAELLAGFMAIRAFLGSLLAKRRGALAVSDEAQWQQLQKEIEQAWQESQQAQEALWHKAMAKQEQIWRSTHQQQEAIWKKAHQRHSQIWRRSERLKNTQASLDAAEDFLNEK
jgi:N-acetylglucosaminyl-diphospho-decaprenol L-rhamnosyltransferase